MRVERPVFGCPVICIHDFLPEADAARVLAEAVGLRRVFLPARVYDGPNATKVSPDYRRNEVVMLDEVFRSAPERSDILTIIGARIWSDECRQVWQDGNYIFDIMNLATWREAVLSRYGDGDFYKKHQDLRRDNMTYRLVTMVYYVGGAYERISGGALVLWKGAESLRIEPRHNVAVVFPSVVLHEVEPVALEGGAWEDGRFSLNYWMGFK